MKIYGEGIYQNERADLVGLTYISYAIERVDKTALWLRDTDSACQHLLAEIDILLLLANKFPHDVNVKLKKTKVKEWETLFFDWFEKNNAQIPKKYRESIKEQGVILFSELSKFGHSLDWL